MNAPAQTTTTTPADETLQRAKAGDINAFQQLFAAFQPQLKSYLYRLLTNRDDADDLAHDTFIRAFDKLRSFNSDASFKTWVFQIATHLAYDQLKKRRRWTTDVKTRAKDLCLSDPTVYTAIDHVAQASGEGAYDIREHISHCFTCMSKTLAIEKQIGLILVDIYDFAVNEVTIILGKSPDVVKHLLHDARQTMKIIFDQRCSLINKTGVCHQCSELNGWFNPKQNRQEALNRLDLVRGSTKYDRETLFALRTTLVKAIDPTRGQGAALQDMLMRCDRLAMGEVSGME